MVDSRSLSLSPTSNNYLHAAALGPALTLVLVTLVGCDTASILVLLALNGLFLGAQYTGNSINLLLLAPNFSGTMLGISNTFANGAGILAPYAVGLLTNGNVSTGGMISFQMLAFPSFEAPVDEGVK